MEKTPARPRWGLVRSYTARALGSGALESARHFSICAGSFSELYRIAHSERRWKSGITRVPFGHQIFIEQAALRRVRDTCPDDLPHADQEAVRQRAVAALNLTQQAKQIALGGAGGDDQSSANTALIDGVRKFAMDVRELDIDLIDRINPFGEAYAILAKTMSEESLKQVAAAISAKRVTLTPL